MPRLLSEKLPYMAMGHRIVSADLLVGSPVISGSSVVRIQPSVSNDSTNSRRQTVNVVLIRKHAVGFDFAVADPRFIIFLQKLTWHSFAWSAPTCTDRKHQQ